MSNVNTGGFSAYIDQISNLATNNVSGNVSLVITGAASQYCGNFKSVTFYTKPNAPDSIIDKGNIASAITSGYQRFTNNGVNPADAYMTSIDFDTYASRGLTWYIYKTDTNYATLPLSDTTFTGGTVYFGLVISGTEAELNSITKVELK